MKSAARSSASRVSPSVRRPRRVMDLLLRPAVQLLEDRSYPGQAPGVMGWALAGTDLAFLDQSLLTFPLDGGESGRLDVAAWHAESAAGPTGSLPADVAPPLADQVAAWVVSLNAGESQSAGSERQAAGGANGHPEETATAAGTWHDDLLPDALAGPLAPGGLDNLSDTPPPRRPFSVPRSGLPAAASGEFSLPSGAGAVSAAPASGNGSGDLGPSPTPLSEADLTALAATRPGGAPAKTLPAPGAPSAALLQTLADNGIAWNGPGSDSGTPPPPQDHADSPGAPSRARSFAKTPLRFEANRGQLDAHAQFVGRASGYNLYLTATEMVLALDRPPSGSGGQGHGLPPLPDQYVIRMQMVGANPSSQLTGLNQFAGVRHYLKGSDRTHWAPNVPSFTQVAYRGVYPGIDMPFYGNDKGQLEYDFSVAPGANPATIRLAFTGTQGVALDGRGNLVLHTPFGDITEHAPVIYQTVNGVRRPVSGRYVVPDAGHIGFQVGTYDHTRPLTIDPFFSYSSYVGGDGGDFGTAITLDGSGSAYITGQTYSVTFPFDTGIIPGTSRGGYDAFVAKLDPTGDLVYFSIFGGSSDDAGTAIQVGADLSPYVVGYSTATGGSTTDLPTTGGVYQPANKGVVNGFVAKLTPDGSNFVHSTFLGGSQTDKVLSLALDSSGSAYVTGSTTSPDFPASNTFKGSSDAFVARLNPAGAALNYAIFLAGTGANSGQGIAVDGAGSAYVTGSTTSVEDFPVANPFQAVNQSGPVLQSPDGGATWNAVSHGLSDGVSVLAADPTIRATFMRSSPTLASSIARTVGPIGRC